MVSTEWYVADVQPHPKESDTGRGLEALAGELAWCLDRFLNANVDEASLARSWRALADWRTVHRR